MTTHLFAIEDGRYLEDEDPRAAWIERHFPGCVSIDNDPDLLFPKSCNCGHDSLRVLAVPGPVGCPRALRAFGSILTWDLARKGYAGIQAKGSVWDKAWERLVRSMNRYPTLDPSGYELEFAMPPDGLYCLADGELRAVEDITNRWVDETRSRSPYHAAQFIIHLGGNPLHWNHSLIFQNDRGEEVVVDRGMLR